MKKSKVLALVLALTLVVSMLAACGGGSSKKEDSGSAAAGEVIELKIAHVLDPSHPVHLGFEKMKELLEEKSGGAMTLKIFPNSALGDEVEVCENQASGSTEIFMSAPSGNALQGFDSNFLVVDFPFQFENYDQVWAFYDGEFGQFLQDSIHQKNEGLMVLDWWDNGFRNLTTTKKEVHTAADLKGMKIRVMSAAVHQDAWNTLGAAATAIPYAEVYNALQQGVVEGQENPVANIYGMKFYEVQKYIIFTRHVHDPSPVVVATSIWDTLTDEQKGWVTEACEEAGQYMRQVSIDDEEGKLQEMVDQGLTVINLTPEELKTFQDGTASVKDHFADQLDDGVLEKYEAALAAVR